MRKWTKGEDNILIEYYNDPAKKIVDLAQGLNRSISSVTNRARILGIKKVKYRDVITPPHTVICRRCGEIKHESQFYNNKSRPNGKQIYCINCSSILSNETLINKARKKIEQEELEKLRFIKEQKDLTFKCNYCRGYYTIDHFSVYRHSRGHKIVRHNMCKTCNRKKSETIVLENIKRRGYK